MCSLAYYLIIQSRVSYKKSVRCTVNDIYTSLFKFDCSIVMYTHQELADATA